MTTQKGLKTGIVHRLWYHAALFLIVLRPFAVSAQMQNREAVETWLESVFSRGIWSSWFSEDDQLYRQFERHVLYAERLLDEGNFNDALSSLKKAGFNIEDIGKSLSAQYRIPRDPGKTAPKLAERPREEFFRYQLHWIQLHLQYEQYYFQTGSEEQSRHLSQAVTIRNALDKQAEAHRAMSKSYLSEYIRQLSEISGADERARTAYFLKLTPEDPSSPDYWQTKILKRKIFVLLYGGRPAEAEKELENLNKVNPAMLSYNTILSIHFLSGNFSQARDLAVQKIFSSENASGGFSTFQSLSDYLFYQKVQIHCLEGLRRESEIPGLLKETAAKTRLFLEKNYLTAPQEQSIVRELGETILSGLEAAESGEESPEWLITQVFNLPENQTNLKARWSVYLQSRGRKPPQAAGSDRLLELHAFVSGTDRKEPAKTEDFHVLRALLSRNPEMQTARKLALWRRLMSAYVRQPGGISGRQSLPMPGNKLMQLQNAAEELLRDPDLKPDEISEILLSWNAAIALKSGSYHSVLYSKLRLQSLLIRGPLNPYFSETTETVLMINPIVCSGNEICITLLASENRVWAQLSGKADGLLMLPCTGEELADVSENFYRALSGADPAEAILNSLGEKLEPLLAKIRGNTGEAEMNLRLFLLAGTDYLPMEAVPLDSKSRLADRFAVSRRMVNPFADTLQPAGKNGVPYFLGIGRPRGGFLFGINAESDEMEDLENIFAEKEIIRESEGFAPKILRVLNRTTSAIWHIAGSFLPGSDATAEPVLDLDEKGGFRIGTLRGNVSIRAVLISRQLMGNFIRKPGFNSLLTGFGELGAEKVVVSLADTPVKFRSAFYYDLYYRHCRKNEEFAAAFRHAFHRSKKGFASDLWPYLMTLYEN